MRIFIYSSSPRSNKNQLNEYDNHLHDFLKNNRDLIPKVCYFKHDSDLRCDAIKDLTLFSHKFRKSNIDADFIINQVRYEKECFIFCDCDTMDKIIINLYKITKNKSIISEITTPCLIEINNAYGYLKIRRIALDKLN
jgi:hypothetical protein